MDKPAQQHGQAAFEAVVSHYEARLIRYAARITGCNDVAQDVVQESFIRLFRKWTGDLEPSPMLSAWLFRVAHNMAVDAVRKRSRRADVEYRHAEEQPETIEPSLGQSGHGGEQALRAESALQALSSREQQLVILKVYEEKTYKEIGEITGLSAGNVGYILHHAMKKMSLVLKQDGEK
jgi:RNA polymerase sigma-70 factor (ECF subfamily)